MTTRRKDQPARNPRRRPATSLEGRENQMISLAVGLAEKQMLEGTASSQVITHYLKLSTSRERLEQEKIALENELLNAKTDMIASGKKVEEMYSQALNAMRSYSGQEPLGDFDD